VGEKSGTDPSERSETGLSLSIFRGFSVQSGLFKQLHRPRFSQPLFTTCVLLLVLLTCSGCGAPTEESPQGGVITFAPSITEIAFALGQGDHVTAVSSFCDFPPEATTRERVGGWMDPDLEKITRLAPELIIVQGDHLKVTELAHQNGTPLLRVDMDSLETITAGIRAMGKALDCQEAAEALGSDITADLEAVRAAVKGRPRPKVLLITGRQLHAMDSLYTVGGPSFLSELIDLAGGVSITQDLSQPYVEASKESVIVEAPEIIIEVHAGEELSDSEQAEYAADWNQLPTLPAVKNGRIHIVCEPYFLLPGPRVTLVARQLAELIHPDVEWPE
jgi:cobalamin transport system substrate-binding protein